MDSVAEMSHKLSEVLDEARNVVFFGGAGVSTESGIPDFRSVDGLYNQKYDYPPETILSHTFYMRHPDVFFRFYREKLISIDALPNMAHKRLAEWEQQGKVKAVITQNIDGLHQAAGSKTVWELHGSIHRNYCEKCRKFYSLAEMRAMGESVPVCSCGGRIKPDVVLYEENLNDRVLSGAVHAISEADTMIIAGTSLNVFPAAGLIDYFSGDHLVVINRTPTPRDSFADLVLPGSVGEIFGGVK